MTSLGNPYNDLQKSETTQYLYTWCVSKQGEYC